MFLGLVYLDGTVSVTRDHGARKPSRVFRASDIPGCSLGINLLITLDVSLTAAVTGPPVERLHRHSEARLCIRNALLDLCHASAGQDCLRTLIYRLRLAEPANPRPSSRVSDDGGFSRVCVGANEILRLDGRRAKELLGLPRFCMSRIQGFTGSVTVSDCASLYFTDVCT